MPNFLKYFFHHSSVEPDQVAVIWNDKEHHITYGELAKMIQSNPGISQVSQPTRHKMALVLSQINSETLPVLLSCLYHGVAVTAPPRDTTWVDLIKFICQSKINYLISPPSFPMKFTAMLLGKKVLANNSIGKPKSSVPKSTTLDTIALMTYTSGSTGEKKDIERSHGDLINQHHAILEFFPQQRAVVDLPLFPNLLLHNLSAGITTVIPDIEKWKLTNLEPDRILKQIRNHKVTRLTGNVFYFSRIIDHIETYNYPLQHLSTIISIGIGGSPVPNMLLENIKKVFNQAAVYIIYGSTEAEPIAVKNYSGPYDPLLGYCVGQVHPDLNLDIDQSNIQSTNKARKIGEVIVSGEHVVTKEGLHTGDYGYILNDELYLVARSGNSAVYEGYYHYQIEHYLVNYEGVRQAAATIKNEKIIIHYVGSQKRSEVLQWLARIITIDNCKVYKHDSLPVDDRHLSKIVYHQL